ncbi:hypothetical protein GRI89_07070 [Altererythrobacter salegens]|uniref:Uncharacterized protein n=1 Tax=Croceibacterium salegens TaxID=1737568 RepID=A0A6I4SW64_9SPHN|nr:hypothetical protein [Croceibacterium salegens]MXO59300.1 hypothetical protein [Croceibacterium salegens]
MSAESNSPEPPVPTGDDSFDVSAEDRLPSSPDSAVRDPPPASQPPSCLRRRPRQGTSYMAFRHEPLEPGDPLLGFRPVVKVAP